MDSLNLSLSMDNKAFDIFLHLISVCVSFLFLFCPEYYSLGRCNEKEPLMETGV